MAFTYTEQLDSMYTSTFQMRKKDIENQIFTSTPFWWYLSEKGHMKSQEGGTRIEQPIVYAKNSTVKSFGRGGTIDISDTNPLTVAYYEWKYTAGSVARYMVDDQRNRGKTAVLNLLNTKVDNLIESVGDYYEQVLFEDGTRDSGLAPNGLASLVSITDTGTVGGLNKATYAWWRNNITSMSGEAPSTYLIKRFKTMFNNCGKYGRGVRRYPNIIVCAQDVYEMYEDEVAEIQRIHNENKIGQLGFGELLYKGIPLTWSTECPNGYAYFLNMNFIFFIKDPFANMDMTEWKPIPNQVKDRVAQVVNIGNLTASALNRHGVIYLIAE